MKRPLILLLAVFSAVLLASPAFAKDKADRGNLTFENQSRTYYIQIPPNADPNTPLPLVLLLHEQGQYATSVFRYWHTLGASQGFIVVAPESLHMDQWEARGDPPGFFHAVVADAAKKHPVDPKRVYLFGEGGGGVYALAIGLYDSEFFAATAVYAAVLDPGNYSLFDSARRKIPFAIWLGDRDPNIALNVVQNQKDAFTAHGFPYQLTVIRFTAGGYGSSSDQVNEGAWDFFRKNPIP